MIWTSKFWKGLAERAIKTFFQTGVAVAITGVGAEAVGISAGILDVSWSTVASVAGLSAILSAATSLGNAEFTAGVKPEGTDAGLDDTAEFDAESGVLIED